MIDYTLKPVDILIVEDNPADVRLTREVLRDSKLHVSLHVAPDGEQALRYLRHQAPFENATTPDLILLDLNLPKQNGTEVLQQVKADRLLRRIPIVILTTSREAEDILRSYDLHANCYVTKPLDLDQFVEVVRTIEDFWLTIVKLPPMNTAQ